jgi:hypothetical protein
MPRKKSKRQVDEEQWVTSQAGWLIVLERMVKRAIQACERYLRQIEKGRRLVRMGFLSEGKFREIYGDVEQKEAELEAKIAEYRGFLARYEGN